MHPFSERIRQIRNGRSQQEVADFLGVTKNKWSTWELGKYEPDLETLVQICKKFDVPSDWVLGLRDTQIADRAPQKTDAAQECQPSKLSNVSKSLLKISENTRELAKSLDELSRTI